MVSRFYRSYYWFAVFIVPFFIFNQKKKLDKATINKCIVLLGMGAFRVLGWFMVRSGLINNPDVSHFRLGYNLDFCIYHTLLYFWVALDLISNRKTVYNLQKTIARYALVFLLIKIILWWFCCRFKWINSQSPMMSDGQFIHDSVFLEQKNLLLSFTEGKSGVQFIHQEP
jgi:cytochrome c oxidase assembly protein subunit 15